MNKWAWAFGSVPLVPKWRWAVTAGDQDPESEDDKQCGDHFIDKNLECHDGDAHRPDPGNNPYWQGGRKGPPSEDPSGKGGSESGERDRREITKKASEKKEQRESKEGGEWTPDRAKEWSSGRLSEYKDDTEKAYQRDFGQPLDWNSEHGRTLQHELAEMTLRDMQREFAGDMDQRAGKEYLPHREGHERRDEPGMDPRRMFRPKPGDVDITFDESKMPPPGSGVYRDMVNLVDWGEKPQDPVEDKDPGVSPEMEEEHEKWGGEGYKGEDAPPSEEKPKKGEVGPYEYQEDQVEHIDESPEESKPFRQHERRKQTRKEYKRRKDAKKKGEKSESALASEMNWSESKIMMDRAQQPGHPGCPSESDLVGLDQVLPDLPGDLPTEGRPCEEGEDPKKGHCKDLGAPARPQQMQGPMSDDPKVLRRMERQGGGGDGGQPPKPPGVGLEPQEDPQRKQRTAQQTQLLKNSDPKDSKRTAWAVGKMFGGAAVKQTDKGLSGSSKPMDEQSARTQYDDARHSMEQSGWQNTSDMGNRSTWSKGGANISMQMGKSAGGQFTNQFVVHAPKPQKKRGLFGMLEATLNWGPRKTTLAEELNWTEARPCTDGDEDSEYGPHGDDQKCVDEGGGYDEGYEDEGSDVPEGFQEVDMGDPGLDPEGGDWEGLLDDDSDDMDVKKTMKEEEKVGKQEKREQEKTSKEQSRTATRIPRDPNLGPDDYHQFWAPHQPDPMRMPESELQLRNSMMQKAVQILEDRMNNPQSPEDSEAARSILFNGPKAGGTYKSSKKSEPGEPGAEDFYEREDRSPIV